MAKWFIMAVLALAVAHSTARTVPSDAGLDDQKNLVTIGGIGAFSGLGNSGLPFGGFGGGIASAGGLNGPGLGGLGGLGSLGGMGSTGGIGTLGGISGLGGGPGTGGGLGGGGAGSLPFP